MAEIIGFNAGGGLVWVTGAAGALGSAIATEFAKEGRDLLLHDYVSVKETETSVKTANASIDVSSVTGDILDPAICGKLFDALGSRRIHVLAHAGGVNPVRKNSPHIFETKFTMTKKLVETFTPRMEEGGVIILIASLEGTLIKNMLVDLGAKRHTKGSWSPTVWLLSKTNYTSYAVSNRCIQIYAKQKAAQLSSFGVRIVSVSPGLVETSEAETHGANPTHTEFAGISPMNRFGRPDEIARVVTFLASPGATYITGTDIAVDGGLASQRWKATRKTVGSLVNREIDRFQQKNAKRAGSEHVGVPASATEGSRPAGESITPSGGNTRDGTAETEPNDAALLSKSLGGHESLQLESTAGKPTMSMAPKSTAAEPSKISKESEADKSQPLQDGQTEGLITERATRETAENEGQVAQEETVTTKGQPTHGSGPKPGALGTLRSRLDKIQQASATRAREAHESAASTGEQTAVRFKSVVGTVRAKLNEIQKDSVERVRDQEEAPPIENESARTKGLKSSVGTLRAKVKRMQERNAARIKSVSTNSAHQISTGIFEPATETSAEAQPAVPTVRHE